MKKFLSIFLALILLVPTMAIAAGSVTVDSSDYDTDEDLRAYVSGETSTTFDWYWMKDGATYYSSTGTSSTLDSSKTSGGEEWTVSAWTPESAWVDAFEYDSFSFTVTGDVPSYDSDLVVVEGECDEDDLSGYVSGERSTTFDFYWMKGGATYKSETGTSTSLDASRTDVGDVWTLSVWVPESAWYDSFEIGSQSVEILDCSAADNSDPVLDAIDDVVVYEGETVRVTASATDADGDDLTYSYSSTDLPWGDADLDSTDNVLTWVTEEGDADVYTVSALVTDGNGGSDSVSFTITVLDLSEEKTEVPKATDIYFTVTEGDAVDVDVDYKSTSLSYSIADWVRSFTESTVVAFYDADSAEDELSYTFGGPLDSADGTWQTAVGDVGVTVADFTVTDAEGNVGTARITITVEAAEVVENSCPEVNANDITVTEGDLAVADYTASDADGDALTVQFSDLFDENGEWQTADGDADNSPYSVSVLVYDVECSASDDFLVYVNDGTNGNGTGGDGNTAPELEPIDDIEVDEGETVEVVAVGSDADGDVLTYTWEGVDDTGAVTSAESLYWETQTYDAGEYTVTVTVSDGSLSASESFTIKVNDLCVDVDADGVCDSDADQGSNYEGDSLSVEDVLVLNANDLYSAYDVSDLDLETRGVFYVDDGYLESSASDNEVAVLLSLSNKNSFDAEDLQVTFVFEGETSYSSFQDLDRSESGEAVYYVEIPEGLETGSYTLHVYVENDDLYNYEAVNLEITSLGDYLSTESGETGSTSEAAEQSFWAWLKSLFY